MPRVRRPRCRVPDLTSSTLKLLLAVAVVVLLPIAVFWPVGSYDFVAYDDPAFVTEHPVVKEGLTTAGVRWVLDPINGYSAAGGPLTFLSHMLDVDLFGMHAGPHHLMNLAMHVLNGALLLLLLWRTTGALGRSACVAALFAVHPLHVESVAWISERKDVLSTLFLLLTMHAYVSYARRPRPLLYAGALMLFALGLMAKTVLVTLPLVLLLFDLWPLRRVALERDSRWRAALIEKIPFVLLALVAMVLIVQAQQAIGALSPTRAIPWTLRLENVLLSYATYIVKMVWPVSLAVFYPYPHVIPAWKTVLSTVLFVGLTAVAWRCRRAQPAVTIGWMWYVVTLVPMIGVIQVGSHAMADRFTYVPLTGLFIAMVWACADALAPPWPPSPSVRSVFPLVAVAAVMACAATARAQVTVWRNSETLWTHALAVTPGNFRAHAGLAAVAAARGDSTLAIAHYRQALGGAPDAAEWHVNLGLVHSDRGEHAEAAASFARALAIRAADPETEHNLAATLVHQRRVDEAITHYQRALNLRPEYALARRNLALAYLMRQDLAAAEREMVEALRLSPGQAQWHYDLAVILLRSNRPGEGASHLRDALRLAPDHTHARLLLAQLGG